MFPAVAPLRRRRAREPILERLLGLESSRAMGIETLNTAAHAAGFAMAADEVAEDKKVEAQAETESWRSEATLLAPNTSDGKTTPSTADWLKSLFGMTGGRAPA